MANKVEQLKKEKDGLDLFPDILRYSKLGYESIPADDLSRMRWFGIYEQKPRNGHFMMRVKIPGGAINSNQWWTLGEISCDFGGGIADITTRQNVQFHWITIEVIPEIIRRLNSVGITTLGACGDIPRNIAGCPVAGIDPDELYDCTKIIEDVNHFFVGNKDFSDLPRKFKITIAGCMHQCHQPEINDIGISAVIKPNGDIGFEVRVGGGLSTQPRFSRKLNVCLKPEQIKDACRVIAEIFRDYGYRERRNHARLKFLMDDWGADRFLDKMIEKLGWTPDPAVESDSPMRVYADHIGVHAQKQHGLHWIGVAILTGRMTSEQMLKTATIAEKYCDGSLRTTNQQNLLLTNITEDDLSDVQAELEKVELNWDVSIFRRSALSCTGTEFCNLAITETKLRLKEIIGYLEEKLDWDEDIRINLNGCPNACGQHHIGDIGLQGALTIVNGTKTEAYDICLGGRLGSNAKFTRPIRRKVPAENVKYALENLLLSYQNERTEYDSFSDFVDRHTDDELGQYLGDNIGVVLAEES